MKLLAIATLALAIMTPAFRAEAGAKDYEFQPVAAEVRSGTGGEIEVSLVHKPDGKPVAGAVVFRSRLDMSPESMGDMEAKLTPLPSKEPGLYRFKAEPTMAGSWALKLMAKVPGESETVQSSVIVKAKD
jgi:YtkA-like